MLTLAPEIHGWKCAILVDWNVIRVSKVWTSLLHCFIDTVCFACMYFVNNNEMKNLNWTGIAYNTHCYCKIQHLQTSCSIFAHQHSIHLGKFHCSFWIEIYQDIQNHRLPKTCNHFQWSVQCLLALYRPLKMITRFRKTYVPNARNRHLKVHYRPFPAFIIVDQSINACMCNYMYIYIKLWDVI